MTMTEKQLVLAIDQGTTSSRALLFDQAGSVVGIAQRPIDVSFPHPGWVNQDAAQIWTVTEAVCHEAIANAGAKSSQIAAIGITNQRETTALWDRKTGAPLAPVIVWQSRQSADVIRTMEARGVAERYRAITGLVLDPYFSASKIRWMLDHDPELEAKASRGEVCFGTVDSWLIWNLTGGMHLTDMTNASRTLLFDIHACAWSDELLDDLHIPPHILPSVVPNVGIFAHAGADFGNAPISGCAGDQHAALFGQVCFDAGQAKNTYGTGSFALLNTGVDVVESNNGLLSTLAWLINDCASYALEGSVLVSGSAVQWLRDELGIIESAAEVETLAATVPDTAGVMFVPALAGLGAPDWDDAARGVIVGITRGTSRAHIARATLEGIAFQVADVLRAMTSDAGSPVTELKVDGGAARNNMLLQIQADLLGVPVVRSAIQETTALGAAYLAGLGVGFWSDIGQLAQLWRSDGRFEPTISGDERDSRIAQWRQAVARSRAWATDGTNHS
jgi:glycerol kinase